MARFIANETFTADDGTEYAQGAIYELDDNTARSIQQWIAEGKVRDADAPPPDDDAEKAEDGDDEDEDDEDEPA